METAGPSPPSEPPVPEHRPFAVHLDLAAGRVELSGHLDFRVVHLVLDAFSTLARGQGRVWVLDATELADWDRSGLLAISAAYRLSLRHQRRLTLAGAPPRLRQALARMRLDHHVLRPDGADPGEPPPP